MILLISSEFKRLANPFPTCFHLKPPAVAVRLFLEDIRHSYMFELLDASTTEEYISTRVDIV